MDKMTSLRVDNLPYSAVMEDLQVRGGEGGVTPRVSPILMVFGWWDVGDGGVWRP